MHSRRSLILSALAGAIALARRRSRPCTDRAGRPAVQVVFQVSDADPAKWNLALNNVRNVQQDLGAGKVTAEIVAYGPGIGMLKMDSVVGPRIAEALASGTVVVACENTMRAQKLHARGHARRHRLRRCRRRRADGAAGGLRLHPA